MDIDGHLNPLKTMFSVPIHGHSTDTKSDEQQNQINKAIHQQPTIPI